MCLLEKARTGVSRRGVLALAAAGLLGCRPAGRTKRRIAVVPKSTTHVFWQSIHAGVLAAGQKLGVEILWNGPASDTDYGRQIQIFDAMVAQRVDGIAVSASDRGALNQALDRAAAAGIPVTVFDSGVSSEKYMTFVATDNPEAGELAAHSLARLMGGKGKAAMVSHAPGSVSTVDREARFEEVIPRDYPGIRIVARQFSMADRARAKAAAENILTAHPDLDGMFCSGEAGTIGAALAVKGRGLDKQVALVGFDSSEGMVEDLKAGVIDTLILQDPYRLGFEAVKTLVDKLDGRTPPRVMQLRARAVTRDDLDQPEVRALLFPDLKRLE